VQIFIGNAAVDLIERKFEYFAPFAGKYLFMHYINSFLGAFDQQNRVQYQCDPQKGTSLQGNTSYDM